MLILNSLKESVERPGVVGSRGLLAEVGYSIWKNRSMRLGVVESYKLHSHHQNGEVLKRENRTKRDGTGKCYRWLAKGDLMTKTGYGYAKCLTVAGTATTCGQDCGHEKCGSCTLTQGPRYIAEI